MIRVRECTHLAANVRAGKARARLLWGCACAMWFHSADRNGTDGSSKTENRTERGDLEKKYIGGRILQNLILIGEKKFKLKKPKVQIVEFGVEGSRWVQWWRA